LLAGLVHQGLSAPFREQTYFLFIARGIEFHHGLMSETKPCPKYKRIVLKLSGEALREPGSRDNISPQIVQGIAAQIGEIHALGVEVAIVVGGGNIWRGQAASGCKRRSR